MSNADIFVNLNEALSNMDNGGLLVGNNLDWARTAVMSARGINMNRQVSISSVTEALETVLTDAEGTDDEAVVESVVSKIAQHLFQLTDKEQFEYFISSTQN